MEEDEEEEEEKEEEEEEEEEKVGIILHTERMRDDDQVNLSPNSGNTVRIRRLQSFENMTQVLTKARRHDLIGYI